MQYQWTILLKSLECFDVHNKYYRGLRSKETIFKLILSNELFPRSVKYTGDKIYYHLLNIDVKPVNHQSYLDNVKNILDSCLNFQEFEDEEQVVSQISDAHDCISEIHDTIKQMYFL